MNNFLTTKTSIFYLLISSLFVGSTAQAAVMNGSFEDGLNDWDYIGDVSIQDGTFGVDPTEGNFQALLTNSNPFIDFDNLNFSGNEPAEVGFQLFTPQILEDFLGLPLGSFDDSDFAFEGSAIKQTLTVQAGDILSLNWNFLTNDTQDYAFIALANTNNLSSFSFNDLTILDNSSISSSPNSPFDNETGYQTFSHTFNSAGTYLLGVGVVDVADFETSSGLLVDNIEITGTGGQKVPEFSSIISLFAVGTISFFSFKR